MDKILYINACVRKASRTAELAEHLLKRLYGEVEEVKLEGIDFPKVDEEFLKKRDRDSADGDFSGSMFKLARQFSEADTIVIAAPFWDLSFPASLKAYFEQINVVGLTFEYNDEGIPVGLCRAKRLIYVTTAGGQIFSEAFGYGYVEALAKGFYGIENVMMFKAEDLDIYGSDTKAILETAKLKIEEAFPESEGQRR